MAERPGLGEGRGHAAEDALGACLAAGLPVRCLSLQRPIATDGRSRWLIHLRDLLTKFPLIDTVNPLPREQSITVPTTGYEDVRAVALARLVSIGAAPDVGGGDVSASHATPLPEASSPSVKKPAWP